MLRKINSMGSFKNHTQNSHPLIFQIRNTFHIFSNIPLLLNFSPKTYNKKGHPIPASHLRFPNPCSGIKISELPISDNPCCVCDQKQKNNITMPIQHILYIFWCPERNNASKDRHQEGMVFELIGSGMRPIKSTFATSNTPP